MAARVTCTICGESFAPAGGGHCGACHRTFRSDSSFYAHRVGPHDDRRCVEVEVTEGWRETPTGWTPHRAGTWRREFRPA